MIAWVDGAWMELDVRGGPSALLSLLDGRTGPGVFETMGAVDGELPLWERHVARIRRGAERLGIPWRFDAAEVHGAARETLERNGERDGVLRMTLVPMAPARSRWLLVARRRTAADRPLRLVIVDELQKPHGPPRDVKCTSRELYDRALSRASAEGADDAVLVDRDGSVLETAVGNVLFARGDRWVTPRADGRLLPGIARGVLIERLEHGPHPIEVRTCGVGELMAAPSVVVTNAVHGPRAAVVLGSHADPEPEGAGERRIRLLRRAWAEAIAARGAL